MARNNFKKFFNGNNRDKTASEPVGSNPALWFESRQAKPFALSVSRGQNAQYAALL